MAQSVRSITQRTWVPASPGDVYRAMLVPRLHAAFTGAPATGVSRVGRRFTAYDGYIMGVHRTLVPGRRIVQEWTTTAWPDGAPPSTVEFMFTAARGGTEIRMVHTNVPAAQAASYRQGWIDYYWKPLREYFEAA